MSRLFHSTEGILCILLVLVLVVGICGLCGLLYQESCIPAFRDVTMELGQPLPPVSAFLTEYGNTAKAELVTSRDEIDLTQVGKQTLTFRQNGREEKVVLTIWDTTAPAVVSRRDITLALGTVPQARELLASVEDASPVTVSFAAEPVVPETYGTTVMEVVVEDTWGNAVTVSCNVHYVWLKDAVMLELGDRLTIGDLLLRPEDSAMFTDRAAVDAINAAGVGSYTIDSTNGTVSCRCTVTVMDTTAPALELRSVTVGLGADVQAEDFVVSATDLSGEVYLALESQPNLERLGTQTVIVEARDASGNLTRGEAVLEILEDIQAPVFQGVETMRVEIGSEPDYELGVVAVDNRDGYVEFTYDASQADTGKSGGFYVTYTATDRAGNTTTVRRWIIVDHDQSDIEALVAKYADQLSDDPVEIMHWCNQNIWYTGDWGNGDPVWFGFTKWVGNCYVHAHCLQAILEHKGYETMLIWTTEKTHYWVLVNIGGEDEDAVWRHLDSTPGNIHLGYGLMDDQHRLWTLSGARVWDFEEWPACE